MILRFLFFIRTFLKHCKALSTEKYWRYINIILYYIISCIALSHSTGKLVPMRITQLVHSIPSFTPFTVHYEKIRDHLREKATNSAKIHSLARKSEHLRVNQIQ